MIKARSKKLSILLVLAMLMTMFVGLGTAGAASSYTVLKTASVSKVGDYIQGAKIAIEISDVAALSNGDLVTVHLPSALELDKVNNDSSPKVAYSYTNAANSYSYLDNNGVIKDVASGFAANIKISAPAKLQDGTTDNALVDKFIAYPVGTSAFEIKVLAAPTSGKGLLYIEFDSIKVSDSLDGDINATFVAPSSSGFSSGVVKFATFGSAATGTITTVKSVVTMGDEKKELDTIMIQEKGKNVIENGEVISLKLPSGFKWANKGTATGAWDFTGKTFNTDLSSDKRVLKIIAPSTGLGSLSSEGRIYLTGAEIEIEDSNAKFGDVVVSVTSDKGNVTDQDIVVAKYADYGAVVEAVKTVEVLAGRDKTELGDIRIKENIAGSIVPNRSITLTLPAGVKWNYDEDTDAIENNNKWPSFEGVNPFTFEAEKGVTRVDDIKGYPASTTNNGRTIKITLDSSKATAISFLLKKLTVSIAPDFAGDINVEVGGNAGVSGTVKVATVKPAVTASVDSVNKVVIGAQGQAIGDIIIKESKKEAIDVNEDTPHLVLTLPAGSEWTTTPSVSVVEGDLAIDKVSKSGGDLTINFKSASTKPSAIKISNVKVTTYRTIPEGQFKLSISTASKAIADKANVEGFNVTSFGSIVIANCVTPAEGAGSATFKVGSSIYTVGGTNKVMDVEPYIKNSRTYVPMRYLGEILGAEVAWDDAARTVTLTKGSDVVVFTIGSTTYTVNGEAKTADVAPEITNSRTMLPARFVAEAFGAQVGWDAGTQTVLIQQ